ncbi:MAG: hypothetical protein IT328_20870 [Caldilineaceae bacterium]|nr:hypothetical protein [Caldilineaceae bacterium]
MFTFRKSAAIALTSVLAVSTILTASANSTTKNLSSNFTLVNLVSGTNQGTISYVTSTGGEWRSPQDFTFNALGAQAIYRQYDDNELQPGSGSVVVSTSGPVGAVVQIQARGQTATSGAYVGVSEGAATANVPLVSRRGGSLSGTTNSQIIIQNASSQQIDVVVDLLDLQTGNVVLSKSFPDINANASVEYDLDNEGGLPEGWFGSASVRSETAGGEVAVVSNFFTGPDTMMTFNAFTQVGRKWFAPLFTSRLGNGLSTPITVQNVSGSEIPAGGIQLVCTKNPNSPGDTTITRSNTTAVKNTASFAFNPAPEGSGYPAEWYGSCIVNSPNHDTAMFVQMRFVTGARPGAAGAYEGILGTGTDTRVVVPLIAKRLANTFASAVTIQNLNESAAANVTLEYKGAIDGEPSNTAPCTPAPFTAVIPAGGSIIQNHRVANDQANAVPQIADLCVGSLTVTSSDQPIQAFVQLDFTGQTAGDPFMAHNAFTVAATE